MSKKIKMPTFSCDILTIDKRIWLSKNRNKNIAYVKTFLITMIRINITILVILVVRKYPDANTITTIPLKIHNVTNTIIHTDTDTVFIPIPISPIFYQYQKLYWYWFLISISYWYQYQDFLSNWYKYQDFLSYCYQYQDS